MRCAEYVARMGEMRNANKIFVGIPEGKEPLGRPRCICKDTIRIYIGKACTGLISPRKVTSGGLL
jgi:hypothetical protein